jgi:deoxyribonuclease-4
MLLGAQVRQAGGLAAALRRAEAIGAEVMQVFAQSPRQWRYPEANAERSAAFGLAWPASPVVQRVVCHAPYLINLGTTDPAIYERSCAAWPRTCGRPPPWARPAWSSTWAAIWAPASRPG